MDPIGGGSPRLASAFVMSVLLHALSGALLAAGTGWPALARVLDLRIEPVERPMPAPAPIPESEQEVMLGEPDSTATSLTWIGYAETEDEHRARLGEFDQAASTRALPSNAAPEVSAVAPQPPPAPGVSEESPPAGLAMAELVMDDPPAPDPQQINQPEPPIETVAEAPIEAASEAEADDAVNKAQPAMVEADEAPALPPAEELPEAAIDPAAAQRALEQAEAALDATLAEAADGVAQVARTVAAMSRPFIVAARDAGPPDPAPPTETPAQADASPADQPQQESAPSAASPLADPGILSDREAIAAAVHQAQAVRDWTKPLAGKGLRVTTVRPRMAVSTQMVASSAADPVVRLWFGPDGKVKRVQTLRSSGSRQVDQAVVDAVYQWRAEGEELAGTKPGTPEATVWLDFRIVL